MRPPMWLRRRSLKRFRDAQDPLVVVVTLELAGRRKLTHWMWFVFPQAKGLGRSDNTRLYALTRVGAHAYLRDRVLGPRLMSWTAIVIKALEDGDTLESIFGPLDAKKFRSCMELFASVANDQTAWIFERALLLDQDLAVREGAREVKITRVRYEEDLGWGGPEKT